MFVLCKHAAILMDAKVLSRLPYEKRQGCRRGKEGGWGRLSDHFALLNLSVLPCFSHPDSRLIFPSPFTLGVVMHVITKLAAVGGYRGILMPETLPWWHPALHLSISIFTAIAPQLSSSLTTVTIIPLSVPSIQYMCMP